MYYLSGVVLALCGFVTIAPSYGIRTNNGYRCPDGVSDEECQNYQCAPNSELVECVNFCNTCEQQTLCIDYCLPGCNCKAGFYRDLTGACVSKAQCGQTPVPFPVPVVPGEIEIEVADDGGCPNNRLCVRSCRRRGRNGGSCVGRRRRHCRCN